MKKSSHEPLSSNNMNISKFFIHIPILHCANPALFASYSAYLRYFQHAFIVI